MIEHVLQLPQTAIPYTFGKHLAERHPGRAVLESVYGGFDFEGHSSSGGSTITPHAGTYHQWTTHWDEHEKTVRRFPSIFSASIRWNEYDLDAYILTFDLHQPPKLWIVGPTREIAEAYYSEVVQWSSELRSEILVFEGGCFSKNEDLYRDIKVATFDNLILGGSLEDDIRADIDGFFASKDLYSLYGIPWKRGILFIGPPGNGKTHAVKALLNTMRCTCLYVKTFDLPQGQFPQAGVSAVFAHARRSTPCIVVLEDIDSLVTGYNRSFFLNELDGFASNHGIVVLATTNHPERLDPAILDRPSRFDRKYMFDLPGQVERERYLRHWNATLAADLALDDTAIVRISEKSEGFSFAYLRELFLSASMRWISDGRVTEFSSVMEQQVDSLRAQMAVQPEDEISGAPPPQGGGFGVPFPAHILASMRGRRAMSGGWTFRSPV